MPTGGAGGYPAVVAAALLLLAPYGALPRERGARIESPAPQEPLGVAPGGLLELRVRLRHPLTPPPGVQQPRVWEEWRVGLRRTVDRAVEGAAEGVEYHLRPLRVRPAGGDRYRLVVVVPPWVLSGTHDLLLRGPGVETSTPEAVLIGGDGGPGRGIDVTLPPGASGVVASLDGERLAATAAAFAGMRPEDGSAPGRVVRFALPAIGGDGGSGDVALETVEPRRCGAGLIAEGGGLAYGGDDEAISVIWEIGDRGAGAGRAIPRPGPADSGALVRVTGLDGHGRPCEAEIRVPAGGIRGAAGCGCEAIPAPRRGLGRTLAGALLRGRTLDDAPSRCDSGAIIGGEP